MTNDDEQVGHVLNRRLMLRLLGLSGAAMWAGYPRPAAGETTSAPTPARTDIPAMNCLACPAKTEGPYFVDEMLMRSDIRSNVAPGSTERQPAKPGARLDLDLGVYQVTRNGCIPIPDAVVDVWHCDAMGAYSDVRDRSFNTVGQNFLRGTQITSDTGHVKFVTIYPGWYPGRAVHIHFKVRSQTSNYEFTSQLFFDDALTDKVHGAEPYAAKGPGRMLNRNDNIYRGNGSQLTLPVSSTSLGYYGVYTIGLTV